LHPALRSFVDEVHATCVRLLAYISGLALLAIIAAELFRTVPVIAASEPVAQPQWIAVHRPYPAFTLSTAELADGELRYAILRHAAGGRKDIMTWGDPATAAPFARIEIYRPVAEAAATVDLAGEIAERLTGLAIPGAVVWAGALESKLGSFALVDFVAAKADGRRRCLGFIRAFDEPRIQISGWYCNEGPELVEHGTVACALDRLMLLSAGGDARVADLFARAETRRKVCGLKNTHIVATPRRNDWIAGSEAVALRGRVAAR
jgi:hypothetical protein